MYCVVFFVRFTFEVLTFNIEVLNELMLSMIRIFPRFVMFIVPKSPDEFTPTFLVSVVPWMNHESFIGIEMFNVRLVVNCEEVMLIVPR